MSNQMTTTTRRDAEAVDPRPTVAPRVDIFENADELLLLADMPGTSPSDVQIDLDKDHLTIAARVAAEPQGAPLRREMRVVDYRRSFLVPNVIDRDKISADLRDGVLWLHLPKSAAVKPRRIEVKTG